MMRETGSNSDEGKSPKPDDRDEDHAAETRKKQLLCSTGSTKMTDGGLGAIKRWTDKPRPRDDEKTSPRIIDCLNDNDVLLGRGTGPNVHVGNVRFRSLVRSEILIMMKKNSSCRLALSDTGRVEPRASAMLLSSIPTSALPERDEKKVCSSTHRIVQLIKSRGGRFLKRVVSSSTNAEEDITNTKCNSSQASASSSTANYYREVDDIVAIDKTKQNFRHQLSIMEKEDVLPPHRAQHDSSSADTTTPISSGQKRKWGTTPQSRKEQEVTRNASAACAATNATGTTITNTTTGGTTNSSNQRRISSAACASPGGGESGAAALLVDAQASADFYGNYLKRRMAARRHCAGDPIACTLFPITPAESLVRRRPDTKSLLTCPDATKKHYLYHHGSAIWGVPPGVVEISDTSPYYRSAIAMSCTAMSEAHGRVERDAARLYSSSSSSSSSADPKTSSSIHHVGAQQRQENIKSSSRNAAAATTEQQCAALDRQLEFLLELRRRRRQIRQCDW